MAVSDGDSRSSPGKIVAARPGISISQAESEGQIATARDLFVEYADSLGFSLCFQDFQRELEELPGPYAPPGGRLLLAAFEEENAGCVALHKLDPGICEMKRFYVRPRFRGRGIGQALSETVIAEARTIGYSIMRLDTVEPKMKRAVALYRELGFREITAYRPNPIEGALYMELQL